MHVSLILSRVLLGNCNAMSLLAGYQPLAFNHPSRAQYPPLPCWCLSVAQLACGHRLLVSSAAMLPSSRCSC